MRIGIDIIGFSEQEEFLYYPHGRTAITNFSKLISHIYDTSYLIDSNLLNEIFVLIYN